MMCVIGCFFYGRIALIGILLAALLILLNSKNVSKKLKIIWRVVLITVILVAIVNYLATINDSFLYWKNWAFAIVNQLFVERKVTDYSVTHMFEDMYYMPEIKTLLIGDGYYTDPLSNGYYGHTDVGFMRLVLYSGVPGVILAYGLLCYCVYIAYQRMPDKISRRFVMCVVVLWIVLECKGESYHRILSLIYPLYLAFTCERKTKILSKEFC